MNNVIVRPCVLEDLGKIHEIDVSAFSDPWTKKMFEDEFSKPVFLGFALEEDGVCAGYICATVLFEDAEIPKVAVHPSFRRKGYGRRLVDAVVSAVKERGAERIFLEVREGNIPAVGLYQSCGFEKTRVRKQYYADGENALEMMKTL